MGITMRDGDGKEPVEEVGDVGHSSAKLGASLLNSGGQEAASLVSPEG
jgi:hypothetical protein